MTTKQVILEEPFILEVEHGGNSMQLETRFMRMGYTYRFSVVIDETEVLFEPDEEGSFRAIIPEGIGDKVKGSLDGALLQTIAETLQKELR